MIYAIVAFAFAFIFTLVLTPLFIKKMRDVGIVGRDVHKSSKEAIPEMGGLAVVFGFIAGVFATIPFINDNFMFLFTALLSILIASIIGISDDIFGIRQRTKSWLPLFAAIPLVITQAGTPTMVVPFIGLVNFGILYPLIIIPVFMMLATNSCNMLAGYNGLEIGLGFIASIFGGLAAVIVGRVEFATIMFAMAGGCLAFLKYNKFPARVFPGDVGTFTIGASIAAAAIVANMEVVGLLVLGPHIINAILTNFDIVRGKPIQKFSSVKNGLLVPPEKKYVQSLYFWVERATKVTESGLVLRMWLIGVAFGFLALFSVFWLFAP